MAFADQRISTAEAAVAESQQAANEETKSSAGDKYETGRAMAQLEMEKNSVQLNEAKKMRQLLTQINNLPPAFVVASGSLVITDNGNFYISIGAGKITVDNEDYFAVSAAAPIAISMLSRKEGDIFTFNSRTYNILKIF